jgi:hypothetical protein
VAPEVKPVTVIGEALPLAVWVAPPLLETHVTVKLVIGIPPLAPAVKGTVDEVATGCVTVPGVKTGALGTVAATKLADAADAGLLPTPLVANTVQVYASPLVSVVTVIGELAPVPVRVVPPLLEVQVAV